MSLGIKFVYGSRFQMFDVRRMEGGLSFARRSSKSYREFWFSLYTSATLTTQGDFRSANEHIGFSVGNTFQRIKQAAPLSQQDFVYDYEAEMADLYGDGVYCTSVECGCGDRFCASRSLIADAKTHEPPF